MRTAQIRQRWLDYFKANGHEIRESVPLISPDPSILFTIAGMVPFIPYITGEEDAPWPRVASVQKCLRTNDIENVGRTTRHGTFFQMNGNFSFGDYFKEGAIDFAWELLTGSVDDGKYGLDGDKLWVTIWDEDEESYHLLTQKIGIDPKHIVKLPRESIFWDTGRPGPAGPCAEWHIDRGSAYGPEAEGGTVDPGGDRYVEIWNLVFDQYMRGEGEGKNYPLLHELDKKAIDTGAGLERLAFVLQGKDNMYETDEVFPVIQTVEQLTGKPYKADPEDDVRMRVVADHVRSSMMLIGDGVRPGNDGAGYVLRRLLRRAIRAMRLLGVDRPVLPDLFPVSRDAMKESSPELEATWDTISQVAYGEEEAFRRTLDTGTAIFDLAANKALADKQAGGQGHLSGEEAFALHDTYGFPIDLTLEMAAEKGLQVDEKRFRALMEEQRERARADAKAKKTGHVDAAIYRGFADQLGGGSEFIGYTHFQGEGRIVGLLVDGQSVPAASGSIQVDVILDRTPFYAEAGGQLADLGQIRTANGISLQVLDVQAPIKGLSVHHCQLNGGTITVDDQVYAEIDVERRLAIARAHTSTHMVHKALHEVVSNEANQAGSENSPSRMRFDFRHSSALEAAQLSEIEGMVNNKLVEDLEVTETTMPLEEARALGAQALFGEKYGKVVRVVSIGGDWSRELCAGTHVPATGHIGRITLLSESSVGSGVRRIEALVGAGAYEFQAREHALVSQLTSLLPGRAEELPEKVASLLDKLRERDKELAALQAQILRGQTKEIAERARRVGQVLLVAEKIAGVASTDALRQLAMDVRELLGSEAGVVVLAAETNGRVQLVAATNEAARDLGVKAGTLVKDASQLLGGGGGGKPDVAQGGGTNAAALDEAFAALVTSLEV